MITLINGNVQNQGGIAVPNGSISLQLNTDATIIAAPGGLVPSEQELVFQFDATGKLVQPANVWSNKELSPQNASGLATYYLVTIYDANGARINKSPMWWQFPNLNGATVDISQMTPYATTGGNVIFYPIPAGVSAFIQLSDVPVSYASAAGFAVQVNAGATGLVFIVKPLDIGVFVPGLGTNAQIIVRIPMVRAVTFLANAPLSQAKASANATGSTTYTLTKNGSAFATINYGAGQSVGVFTQVSDAVFAAGDVLEFDGPATADATLANVGITLAGIRA